MIRILEGEILKKGTTSFEIIKTLHFDMAIRRVSMSNSVLSLKNLSRCNWTTIFEKVNPVELILKKDSIYSKMSFHTKQMYLLEIQKIAQKANVSEVYVGNVLIKLAEKEGIHIGFFLFRNEREMLANALECPKIFHRERKKQIVLGWMLLAMYLPSIILSYWLFHKSFWLGIFPISEVFFIIFSDLVKKIKKPN